MSHAAVASPLSVESLVPGLGLAVVERIVERACRAPSGDNCQPWRLTWDGATLVVRHVRERAAHWYDEGDRASLLTLGCLLTAFDVAASAEGLAVEATVTARPGSTVPWATLRFVPAATRDELSVEDLESRYTERRAFRPAALPLAAVRSLLAESDAARGARLYLSPRAAPRLLHYVTTADELVIRHEPVHRDVLRQIHFGAEAATARAGMPWQTLGASWPETRVLALTRGRFPLQRALNALGFAAAYRANVRRLVTSSAALLCLATDDDGAAGLVAAGRLGMRAWLRATAAGFAAQPLTAAALKAYEAALGLQPADTPPRFRRLFEAGAELLRQDFGIARGELPVWALRIGRPPGPPPFTTRRLPLEDVLEVVSKHGGRA